MNPQSKSDFAAKARALRIAKQLKQREVAEAIGIAPATYGNLESAPHKVVRRERAVALADFYGLKGAEREDLLDAWEQTPLSQYGERQREIWSTRNKQRSKVRHYDRMKVALVETLSLLLLHTPAGVPLCTCEFGGGTADDPKRSCEVCSAFEALGLSGFTTKDRAVFDLAALQDKLEKVGT